MMPVENIMQVVNLMIAEGGPDDGAESPVSLEHRAPEGLHGGYISACCAQHLDCLQRAYMAPF